MASNKRGTIFYLKLSTAASAVFVFLFLFLIVWKETGSSTIRRIHDLDVPCGSDEDFTQREFLAFLNYASYKSCKWAEERKPSEGTHKLTPIFQVRAIPPKGRPITAQVSVAGTELDMSLANNSNAFYEHQKLGDWSDGFSAYIELVKSVPDELVISQKCNYLCRLCLTLCDTVHGGTGIIEIENGEISRCAQIRHKDYAPSHSHGHGGNGKYAHGSLYILLALSCLAFVMLSLGTFYLIKIKKREKKFS